MESSLVTNLAVRMQNLLHPLAAQTSLQLIIAEYLLSPLKQGNLAGVLRMTVQMPYEMLQWAERRGGFNID